MRLAIQLKDCFLPHYGEQPSEADIQRLKETESVWETASFSGYQRVLDPNSNCAPNVTKIRELAHSRKDFFRKQSIKNFLLLGTGGSSLGGEAILQALKNPLDPISYYFLDNNDPSYFGSLLESFRPEETFFYVVSKSGKTPETLSQLLFSLDWIRKKNLDWKKHFVFCTDPNQGDLLSLGSRLEIPCLPIPSAVGGRFSVLTPVGLFPAAIAGLDIDQMLEGAKSLLHWEDLSYQKRPYSLLANSLAKGLREKPITVMMPYSSRLGCFALWFCQLWAESLGKNNKGFTPYPAMGTTDQHSQMQLYMEGPRDKIIVLLKIKQHSHSLPLSLLSEANDLPSFTELGGKSMLDLFEAEFLATRDALTKAGVPNCTLEIDYLDEFSMGALFYFWERVTAHTGAILGLNPFDQPGVEAAKVLTKKYLSNS